MLAEPYRRCWRDAVASVAAKRPLERRREIVTNALESTRPMTKDRAMRR